jgi:hypothetical protein
MRREMTPDLLEFDPVPANLDLLIRPTEKLERAVRQAAREVTCPEEASAGILAERIGDEPLRRQAGPTEVAASHARSTDVDLPRTSS